ncbi:MAG: LysM peptidoglycan-binding domain-containing protein [Oscillospiraceae bacterium]
MKKRLLCLLLIVTLLVGLMPAAFAEGNIVSYTVKSGDTMLTICEDAGLDYLRAAGAYMNSSGFTSESQLGMIYPGQTIKLPASVEVSAKIMSGELNPDGTVSRGEARGDSRAGGG